MQNRFSATALTIPVEIPAIIKIQFIARLPVETGSGEDFAKGAYAGNYPVLR